MIFIDKLSPRIVGWGRGACVTVTGGDTACAKEHCCAKDGFDVATSTKGESVAFAKDFDETTTAI